MATRALVISGGGARGCFQVGMLHELVINQGIDFDVIRGVSVGALNAAFLAQANVAGDSLANLRQKVLELEGLWTNEITGNHSVYGDRAGFAGLVLGADSLYTLDPLKRLIGRHVDVNLLRASGRDFAVGTVSLLSGEYAEWAPSDPGFSAKLLASASIPVVFPFVRTDSPQKDFLVDGGARNITPLASAFRTKPEEIYVLMSSRVVRAASGLPTSTVQAQPFEQWDDNWLGTKVTGLDVMRRTIDILTDEVYLKDIRGALEWNRVLKAIEEIGVAAQGVPPAAAIEQIVRDIQHAVKKKYVKLNVLAPQKWFGDDNDSTNFSRTLIADGINHGQDVARDPSRWLWP